MSVKDYKTLVVQWHPEGDRSRTYRLILLSCFSLALLLAILLTAVNVRDKDRPSPSDIPESVVRFIDNRPESPEPEITPEPESAPPPVAEPKPVVEREREALTDAPLTERELEARERAEQSGLLALGNQLADIMDTSDIDAMVDTEAVGRPAPTQTLAAFEEGVTPSAASRASAGVSGQYAADVGAASLSQRELAVLTQDPVVGKSGEKGGTAVTRSFAHTGRTEEEVTLAFDQYKGSLYSLYNRARRKTPGLKGRLVIELTIAPSGEVSEARIVSSDLDNARLERRIRNRVKQFRFKKKEAEPVTIVFPIEFLPS